MNINKTIQDYLNELSSNSPTPGGGNVSAFCAVLSSSLGEMVCNLTIGKKKYAESEPEIIEIREKLKYYRDKFIKLAEEDNKAFDKVMEAFKLHKETESEKAFRTDMIEQSTLYAAEIPAILIKTCNEVLPLVKILVNKGNQNSVSDAGVAVLLLSAAAQGAYINVLINCKTLQNQTIAGEILKSSEILSNQIKQKSEEITFNILKNLNPDIV